MDDTSTYVYENTGKEPLTFVNVGVVEPGETVKSPVELNHPDLKLSTENEANDEGPQEDSAPAANNEQDAEESAE